jgi:mono/diheme cytochrome c family protein
MADYRSMLRLPRIFSGLLSLGALLAMTGCPGEYGGGYDKVPHRERAPLAMAAAPDPPPFAPGFGAPAATPTALVLPDHAPAGITQEMVEEGQRLYGTVCTACHGAAGVGTPAGPGLRDQDWIHIDGSFDQLVAIIRDGVANSVQYPGMMPPNGGGNFTPDEVRAIAAYVFALSHTDA